MREHDILNKSVPLISPCSVPALCYVVPNSRELISEVVRHVRHKGKKSNSNQYSLAVRQSSGQRSEAPASVLGLHVLEKLRESWGISREAAF